ncbi:MAG: hypothetical protein EP335_08885 [Alphaproteobacteria bacterium]|nr:MAG: hypothetical protein EP335_08885 [Alphaproteobacteria bacterium]
MIKALDIATQGMLQAERRATDVAAEILKGLSGDQSFQAALEGQDAGNVVAAATKSAPASNTGGAGYADVIQQMADLKASEHAFKANATVFKRLDETLGSLLDAKG